MARIRGDQRTLTIALETYYLDHNVYPAWSIDREENAFVGLRDRKWELARIPTWRLRKETHLDTLTTPVSYVSSYFPDPFTPVNGATFAYWHDEVTSATGIGYIVWSPGPDKIYDLTIDNIAQAYCAAGPVPSPYLIERTYDPSNGTKSRGDVYRYKQ